MYFKALIIGAILGMCAIHAQSENENPIGSNIADLIARHHYRHPNLQDVIRLQLDEINDFLASLDPYSKLLTEEEYSRSRQQKRTVLLGLGLQVLGRDGVHIGIPFRDGPAFSPDEFDDARFLLRIDGQPVTRATLAVDPLESIKPVRIDVAKDFLDSFSSRFITPAYYMRPSVEFLTFDATRVIRIYEFRKNDTAEQVRDFLTEFNPKRGDLILDLRFCPGGSLLEALDVVSLFLPEDAPMITLEDSNGVIDSYSAVPPLHLKDRPIPILVSRYTASSAEVAALVLRGHDRAAIIGEPTKGKCLTQRNFEISDDSTLRLSVAEVFNHKHSSCQGAGVAPDYVFNELETLDTRYLVRSVSRIREGNRYFVCQSNGFDDEDVAHARLLTMQYALPEKKLKYSLLYEPVKKKWHPCTGPEDTMQKATLSAENLSSQLGIPYLVVMKPWFLVNDATTGPGPSD
uniref:Carboxyl-terminal processing protease n=1 Tax=Candidatus Kentrum sp. UNK TaxID=2126344 RepID=A0A451AXI5_9GAMM|nr:MAG: carboxyl-terminal processing protease [Candidatus Kentron sp. UNK]VFK70597.1 MAG: carboxyl-terminal processing protease [Candidatus Kentron sp. UNK]